MTLRKPEVAQIYALHSGIIMSLLRDGRPADPAFSHDWKLAVERALKEYPPGLLLKMKKGSFSAES